MELKTRALLPVVISLLFLVASAAAQNSSQPASQTAPSTQAPAASAEKQSPNALVTKVFEIKYIDPEQLRQIYSARSFVMEVNRDLKALTVHGTPEFVKEVEDTVKRFDVPPIPPANFQITVYLLTGTGQGLLPKELESAKKDLEEGSALKLAGSQMMRVREGQPGEVTDASVSTATATLSRVRARGAYLVPSKQGDIISVNGLQVWLNVPDVTAKADADISLDVDLIQDKPVVISKTGSEKPIVLLVRASVATAK